MRGNVLGNISWRAWKVWRRNADVFFITWKTNFLPSFIEPVLYLLAMGLGFGMFVSGFPPPYDKFSYVQFLAPALVAIQAMYGAFFECTYGSFVRMHFQKTYDAIVATPLTIEDVITGEILWGATKSLINGTIVMIVVFTAGLVVGTPLITIPGLIIIPFICALAGLAFASLAMTFTALVPNIDSFNYPFFLFFTPMFLLSGTFFPLGILPRAIQDLAQVFPLTHTANLIRDPVLGIAGAQDVFGLIFLLVWTAAFFYLAVYLMKRRLVN
ncbi:MAG TPA: ABC transporter permease [Methanomassiliicoccales archaeon]|nr:ABC transporter permease [Methanomassiliicoccales archaeon]